MNEMFVPKNGLMWQLSFFDIVITSYHLNVHWWLGLHFLITNLDLGQTKLAQYFCHGQNLGCDGDSCRFLHKLLN